MLDLRERARWATQPEFINGVLVPAIRGANGGDSSLGGCETSVALDRGTGRVTMCYSFDGGLRVFGKLYSDELGPYGARLLEQLWDGGFSDDGPFRVSQPLAFLPEHNLLLTKEAEGNCMLSFIGRDDPEILDYVRRAAHWLVELHRCPVRIGNRESLWDSLRLPRILRRITKAAARAPHSRKRLIGMVERLCARGQACSDEERIVLTHGRYHNEHIYVSDDAVTLIDFDRASPSYPGKDLAEFLSVLRHRTFKRTGSVEAAEAPTKAFVEEYLSQLPENADFIVIHWGAFLLMNLLHYAKKYETESPDAFERKMRFYEDEFETIMGERWMP